MLGPLETVLNVARAAVGPWRPGRVFTAVGDVAWDDCCEGQLWARVVSERAVVPAQGQRAAVDSRHSVTGWTLTVGVGHLHCCASLDDDGTAPAPAEITAETTAVLQVADRIREGFMCTDVLYRWRPRLVSWTPLGPEGGCVGGEWLLDLNLMP